MRRIHLIFLSVVLAVIPSMAQYVLYSVTPGVTLKTGTAEQPAAKGATVRGSDVLRIPQRGKVEVLNSASKKIFSSTTTGEISVFDLVMNATKSASNHAATVGNRLNFGKNDRNGSGTVFREAGMVRRSMAVYDPEGQAVEMDAARLGRLLAAKILSPGTPGEEVPVQFHSSRDSMGCGLSFSIENTLDYPVYFNIFKVSGTAGSDVEISILGQPMGCYVLLPAQSISRTHRPAVAAGERHMVLMAPCRYDIDPVIEEMRKALSDPGFTPDADTDRLPVFVGEM